MCSWYMSYAPVDRDCVVGSHSVITVRLLCGVVRFIRCGCSDIFELILQSLYFTITVYCRSQWPLGLRRRSSAARLLRLWVRIPPGAWMFVCLSVVSVMGCQAEVSATG